MNTGNTKTLEAANSVARLADLLCETTSRREVKPRSVGTLRFLFGAKLAFQAQAGPSTRRAANDSGLTNIYAKLTRWGSGQEHRTVLEHIAGLARAGAGGVLAIGKRIDAGVVALTQRIRRAMPSFITAMVCACLMAGGWWMGEATSASQAFVSRGPVLVNLGQFSAPLALSDGGRGLLVLDARVVVNDQAMGVRFNRELPVVRHSVLQAVYDLAAGGEPAVNDASAAEALRIAVNSAYGAPIADAIAIESLKVQ